MDCIIQNSIIDSILYRYKEDLGDKFEPYKNHAYRVYNYAITNGMSKQDLDKLAIASAFHDLGIWSGKTFDYIDPSVDLLKHYSIEHNIEAKDFLDIEILIRQHHKLTKVKTLELAEVFRQADLVDLSLGLFRFKRSWNRVRDIKMAFPNKGFHSGLVKLAIRHCVKHPFNPFPCINF
jgi:hypothetical protein